jgi:hypothetical protein
MPDQQSLENIPTIYSNSMQVAVNFADVKLFFGETIPLPPPDNMVPGQLSSQAGGKHVNRLCVIFSPDILPAMIEGLVKAMGLYQAQFGALRKIPQIPQGQPQTDAPIKAQEPEAEKKQ